MADAASYASQYGVSQAEAERRLQLSVEIGDLNARLTEREAGTFGGLSLEHEPEFSVIVRFTADGEATLAPYVDGTELADLVRVVRVKTSLARLEAAAQESAAATRAVGISSEVTAYVRTNRVVTEVTRSHAAELSARLQARGRSLPPEASVVEVAELAAPQANVYAGFRLVTPSSGWCTTGFSVVNQYGTKGVSTAGHCHNTLTLSLTGVLMPYIHGLWSGPYDVQWHTAPGRTVQPWATDNIDDSTPGYRVIRSTTSRANQYEGMPVCKFGTTSSYTCGTVESKTYKPESPSNATATFIKVKGTVGGKCISAGGDSGGPWYRGSAAVGIHGGGGAIETRSTTRTTWPSTT